MAILARVKLFKSILECSVSGCAECDPISRTCYYCMDGAILIDKPPKEPPDEPPVEPSNTPTQECIGN